MSSQRVVAPAISPEAELADYISVPDRISSEPTDPLDDIWVNPRTLQISWPSGEAQNIVEVERFVERLRFAVKRAEDVILTRSRRARTG